MDDVIKAVVDNKEDKLERLIVLQAESRKTYNTRSNEGLDQTESFGFCFEKRSATYVLCIHAAEIISWYIISI